MQLVYQSVFDLSPCRFLDIWVEMVVPSADNNRVNAQIISNFLVIPIYFLVVVTVN